jgi:hypothetical protein
MDVRRVLRGLGAHGLPAAQVCPSDRPPDDDDWRQLRLAIRYERVTGQARCAADTGVLLLTDQQREDLEDEHLQAMGHVLRLERALLRVRRVLDTADVPFVVLKGTAVAHLDYDDPTMRTFGDNDVLVPGDRFPQAIDALLDAGYRRPAAEVGPGFDVRFGKGATLVADDAYELDLHRTFVMGPYGLLVDLDELWQDLSGFPLGGRRLLALGTEQRYLHACYHAVLGNPEQRVQPYRDVAEMLLFGTHDPDRVRELAAHWGAEVVLARAITDTWDALGLLPDIPLVAWARARRPTRREEGMLRLYAPGSSYAAKAAATIRVLPGWRERVEFARMLALPGRRYARSHGRSRLGWLLHGARGVVRTGRESRPEAD